MLDKTIKKWLEDFINMREYTAQTVEDRVSVAIMRGNLKLAKKLWDSDAGARMYALKQWEQIHIRHELNG